MKKIIPVAAICLAALMMLCRVSINEGLAAPNGETLFMKNCQTCHKNGGNIINAKKTLSLRDRQADGMITVEDLVKNMRNPGPGMTSFDENTISNAEARAIAEYILKTFK